MFKDAWKPINKQIKQSPSKLKNVGYGGMLYLELEDRLGFMKQDPVMTERGRKPNNLLSSFHTILKDVQITLESLKSNFSQQHL